MLNKLTDRVYYMSKNDELDKPILGLICGSKYSLVVDSGISPEHAREFLACVEQMKVPPVKYLVITHFHYDHIFGIKEMKLTTIGHRDTKAKLQEYQAMSWDDAALDKNVKDGIFTEFSANIIKQVIPDRSQCFVGDLDIVYEDSLEIDLGDLTCIVKAVGGDHTSDATIIYVPDEKVLFLGDCVYGSRYNGAYGYTKEKLLPMIDQIEQFKAEHYIVSHEEILTREALTELWEKLRRAEQVVGAGTSIEEAITRFADQMKREPLEEEAAYMKLFVNVNAARSR